MSETFRCEMCGGSFPKEWTDEEANAEAARDFPGQTDLQIVCHDCYLVLFPEKAPN